VFVRGNLSRLSRGRRHQGTKLEIMVAQRGVCVKLKVWGLAVSQLGVVCVAAVVISSGVEPVWIKFDE
jgi:hypothetical protein